MSVNTTFSLLFIFLKGYLTTVGVITYVEAKCINTWGNKTKKRKEEVEVYCYTNLHKM